MEDKYVIQNQCDINRGYIEYDISFIHPDFGVAIQEYSIETQTSDGQNIYNSNFTLFKKNEVIPTDLSNYPKHYKIMVWESIFQMKWHYFSKYKPAIVQHFIKHPHNIDKRFELYKKHLNVPGYEIYKDKYSIWYKKNEDFIFPPTPPGGFFML